MRTIKFGGIVNMGKRLAIRGHSTRGKEVIELLKMMGGEAIAAKGYDEHAIYVIPENGIIDARFSYQKHIDNYAIFTLEEFLEKYPFKVGDKVTDLKSDKIAEVYKMHWSENNSCVYYDIKYPNNCGCQRRLMDLKPMDDDYTEPSKMKNVLAELLEHIKTTPKDELEREFEEIEEWSNIGPTVEEFMTFCECVNKKLVYPKTYDECCKNVLGLIHWGMTVDVPMHYSPLIINFTKLLICRDAYWKIAGVQMGLGKPWEPDWTNLDQLKYCIWVDVGEFITMINVRGQHILAFPTEEMRDAFYENFKDLIEQCKELL